MTTIYYPAKKQTQLGRALWDAWSFTKYAGKKVMGIVPEIMPPILKRPVHRKYFRRHRLTDFVETGTWLGDAVNAMIPVCEGKLYSIEVQPELCKRAQERFAHCSRVDIRQGNSAEVLPAILTEIHAPALFWLDGHFPPGIAENCCPTFDEVKLIVAHPVRGHVILIDDAREFKGHHGYPTIAEVRDYIHNLRPEAHFEVENDIMRITNL